MKTAFTYVYRFRMRPNTYPKLRYQGIFLMDSDAPFETMMTGVTVHGAVDEQKMVLDRYQIQIDDPPRQIFPHAMDFPRLALNFKAGAPVGIVVSRDDPRPPKLRTRKDGGEGIVIEVWIKGAKVT